MQTEAAFTNQIVALAKLYRWRVAHFRPAQMQSGRWATPMQGDKGFPDLVLARDGEVILAELKTNTGRLGQGQPEWAQQIGAQYRLWRPRDMDQIVEELKWKRSKTT